MGTKVLARAVRAALAAPLYKQGVEWIALNETGSTIAEMKYRGSVIMLAVLSGRTPTHVSEEVLTAKKRLA